jgi:hypothetical protein
MVFPEPGGPHRTATEGNNIGLTICIIYKKNVRTFPVAMPVCNGSQK